jgi:hypothetical protein
MSQKKAKKLRQRARSKVLEPGMKVMSKEEHKVAKKEVAAGLDDVLEAIAGMPFKARLLTAWSLLWGRGGFTKRKRL